MTSDRDITTTTDASRPTGRVRRREALAALGTMGVTGLIGGRAAFGGGDAGSAGAQAADSCILTPEITEGPYYIDTELTRRDIRGGKRGLPLELVFMVQNARTCNAIRHADVELWHCDADGVYSGFESQSRGEAGGGEPGGGGQGPSSATRYLRGHQRTDADGQATFLTIFPGWYRGRTPHIHLKVHVGGEVVHTGQVFFNERTTAAVYRQAPYSSHGQSDTSHSEDTIYAQAGRSRAVMRLRRRTRGRRGYRGTITLGVAT
jgi:protocatechuate 3,4-dioxygenase beta subunit